MSLFQRFSVCRMSLYLMYLIGVFFLQFLCSTVVSDSNIIVLYINK